MISPSKVASRHIFSEKIYFPPKFPKKVDRFFSLEFVIGLIVNIIFFGAECIEGTFWGGGKMEVGGDAGVV